MLRRCCALSLVVACAWLASSAAQEEEWIEFYDKASNKKAYYHSETRKSAWEPPEGAKVRYMTAGESSAQQSAPSGGQNGGFVLACLIIPPLLLFGGLWVLAQKADGEGLMDVLKGQKKSRDRAQKRRGTKSGGNFKHKMKLSQDGKGGRSANS